MSGSGASAAGGGGIGFTELGLSAKLSSPLIDLLAAEEIVPGSAASYQTCKTILAYHPLGAKMAEAPINMAQSQPREIAVPGGPESRLIPAFQREWAATANGLGADELIKNTMKLARVYGIASIVVGDRKSPEASADPLPIDRLHDTELYYNVLDPLNTAGSLVLDQDPNSPDFQKPRALKVGARTYHPSRSVIVMNEQPIYIEFTSSGFGFVGRSVYQRPLFPMKTFIQSMITDQYVTQKVGLLIAKMKAPGPVMNNRIMNFFGIKRQQLKAGLTGNVLTIGTEDSIESLNFQNLEGAARFSRDNCLKNIAMGASMPAKLLEQEEMIGGMAEGTEDSKQIARYIDRVRIEMNPLYAFFDGIVQRRAWSPDFYKTIQRDYEEYRKVPYETAFYQWTNSFKPTWPNLLAEPESKRLEAEKIRFESVVALVESLSPLLDPENKAALVSWAADEINSRRDLFSSPLTIDEDALAAYVPPASPPVPPEHEEEPPPFSGRT